MKKTKIKRIKKKKKEKNKKGKKMMKMNIQVILNSFEILSISSSRTACLMNTLTERPEQRFGDQQDSNMAHILFVPLVLPTECQDMAGLSMLRC